ncbi:hypothetical protein [Pelagibius sp.]|uniref:hypothetical protein n=1 Tax=Pelagibius sp. TaxID=1931238 RepID=UPI003B501F4D
MAAAMAAAGPASADFAYAQVTAVNTVTIKVESDGERYTQTVIPSSPIHGEIIAYFNSDGTGTVEQWRAWPSILAEGMDNKVQLHHLGLSESYRRGDRPSVVKRRFSFKISPSDYKHHTKAACNTLADHMRYEEGRTNEEIFAEDHMIPLAIMGDYTYEMTGLADHPHPPDLPVVPETSRVQILCAKAPAADAPTVADPVREKPEVATVTLANLKVVGNDSNTGACSVSLLATLKTEAPHTQARFYFESQGGQKSDLKKLTTPGNAFVQKRYDYPLPGGGTTKTGKIRMVIEGDSVKSDWEDYEVRCELPLQTLLPPKAAVLTMAVDEEVSHKGKMCPAVVTVIGRVDGRGKASGKVMLGAAGNQIAEKSFSFEGDEKKLFVGKHQISWQGKPATRQDLPLTMMVQNALGDTVDTLQKMRRLECRRSAGAGDGAAAPRFAIRAPRGLINSGDIQLAGGKKDAQYVLRFYRKVANGYQRLRSTKLPTQMTGSKASFDLAALTGGHSWRLQVCPAASKGTKDCKTSEFQLPSARAAGKARAPGTQGEAKVFILPGSGG